MRVTFISGNLMRHPGLRAIAHGCNCRGIMGAGVALQVRTQYPKCFQEYSAMCKSGRLKLGGVHAWKDVSTGMMVFNMATQQDPGADATLPALEQSLLTWEKECISRKIATVGLPKIGAGIGGLRWEDVKALLVDMSSQSESSDVDFLVFEEFVP